MAKVSPATRATHDLRLGLVKSLVAGGVAIDDATHTADSWLLAGLAAELLGHGGAMSALVAATEWDFAPVATLAREITKTTGLAIASPASVGGIARSTAQPGLPFSVFAALRDQADPFGELGQLLRATRIVEGQGGALGFEPSERRRDEGGYYTPYRLARRLAQQQLEGFDDVPSVLDPACGAGTFLTAAFDLIFEALADRRRRDPSRVVEPVAWTVAALHGVELDPTALLAARLSLAVRAVRAEQALGGRGQMALFGQAQTYGPLIADRLRLGDALAERPADLAPGTERLRLRLLARDVPGRLDVPPPAQPVSWDSAFPLRFSDDEGAWSTTAGFDRLVTNPPFVPVDRVPPEYRALLAKSLDAMQKRFDLFIGFVERSLTLLAPGGRATLLIPRTFLTEANAEKCRRLLLDRATVERLEELGPIAFDRAKVECIALTFSARRAGDTAQCELVRRGPGKPPVEVPIAAFRRAPKAMFRFELAEAASAECLRITENSIPLGRYFCASWGARGSPVSDFHLDVGTDPLAKPMLKGADVSPFRCEKSTRWLLYDTDRLYRPSRPEFFEHEKLVVKKVSGAQGLVVAVDAGLHYTDDSLACVVRKADLSHLPMAVRRRHAIRIAPNQIEPSRAYGLHLVAALLQSPLVQTYYRVELGGGLNVFPELIESLPLPRLEALARPECAELEELGRRAAKSGVFDLARADVLARALYGL